MPKSATPTVPDAAVGPGPMPRTEAVGRVWAGIREHGPQDPANQQAIVAGDRLRAVLGRDRATVFEAWGPPSLHPAAA